MVAWDCQVSAALSITTQTDPYIVVYILQTWHDLHPVFLAPEASWIRCINIHYELGNQYTRWKQGAVPNALEADKESIFLPPPLLHLSWHNPTSEPKHQDFKTKATLPHSISILQSFRYWFHQPDIAIPLTTSPQGCPDSIGLTLLFTAHLNQNYWKAWNSHEGGVFFTNPTPPRNKKSYDEIWISQ